jgi:hypothetical protein
MAAREVATDWPCRVSMACPATLRATYRQDTRYPPGAAVTRHPEAPCRCDTGGRDLALVEGEAPWPSRRIFAWDVLDLGRAGGQSPVRGAFVACGGVGDGLQERTDTPRAGTHHFAPFASPRLAQDLLKSVVQASTRRLDRYLSSSAVK